jgi:hypothetical protein
MEFLKDSSKNLQTNSSYRNSTLSRPARTDRNFYFPPGNLENPARILEQNNVLLYRNSLPSEHNLVAPNRYYLQNESGFGQNFLEANYFEREFTEIQRESYQKENNTNLDKASNIEINQHEKEYPNHEKVSKLKILLIDWF